MKNLLWWLFSGSRGGKNRVRIVNLINKNPVNTQQISNRLNLNYKTVNHHLKLLEENRLIERTNGVKYGACFFLTGKMISNYQIFEEIKATYEIGE